MSNPSISKAVRNIGDSVWVNNDGLRTNRFGALLPMGPGNQSHVVDKVNGPYFTLTAAKEAAQSGDTIIVYPGTYSENNLLKNGITWLFMPGAIVSYTDPGSGPGYGIFDDRATGAVTCRVHGHGQFIWRGLDVNAAQIVPGTEGGQLTNANPNTTSCVYIANAGTSFYLEAVKIGGVSYAGNGNGGAAIWISDCALCITNTTEIINPDQGVVVFREDPANPGIPIQLYNTSIGIYWEKGLTYNTFDYIKVSSYCLYGSQSNAATASDWYVKGKLIESEGVAYYNNGPVTNTPNWRTWVEVEEIKSAPIGCSFLGGGKHYLKAMKIGVVGDVNSVWNLGAGDCEAWLDVQKISAKVITGMFGSISNDYTGTCIANIMHFEQLAGSTGPIINVNSGTFLFTGQLMKTNGSVPAINLGAAGNVVVANYKIVTNTTNNAANRSALVASNGLTLKNVTCVTPALALESVHAATAKNVAIHGHCMSNKAKHANVTFTPLGVFTVDAAVA